MNWKNIYENNLWEYKIITESKDAYKKKEYSCTSMGLNKVDGIDHQNICCLYQRSDSYRWGGNTRTTAVFIELYLKGKGFYINNEPFYSFITEKI